VGALIFEGDSILLVERAGEPLRGYWSLPGGLLETGETIEDGVRREVREETGLLVEVLHRFDIFERIIRDADGCAEYHYVLVDYVCKVIGGEPRAGDDVSRLEWVKRTDLSEYQLTEGTLEAIQRAFANVR
jgi:8-oxo-dGTP diphosphatase